MSWICRLLAVAAALFLIAPAAAQTTAKPVPGAQHAAGDSVSYSAWTIDGRVVRLQVSLPTSEAEKLGKPGQPPPDAQGVANAVAGAFGATSAGRPCTVVDQGEGEGLIYRLALTPGIDRFEMIFLCASPDHIAISNRLLFDRFPGHIDFARVQIGSRAPFAAMFTRSHRSFELSAAKDARNGGGLLSFAGQGALNLARHADQLLMLVGIVLFCTRRRDLLFVGGGIAAGELAALALGLQGLALARPLLTSAATGLLIAGLGAAAMRSRTIAGALTQGWKAAAGAAILIVAAGSILIAHRAGAVAGWSIAGVSFVVLAMLWGARSPGGPHWLAWFAAFLSGLLGGLTVVTNLAVLEMAPARTAAPLAAWMVGATLAAIGFAALAMFVLWLIGRKRASWRERAVEVAGALLIGMGLFWFVSRVWT